MRGFKDRSQLARFLLILLSGGLALSTVAAPLLARRGHPFAAAFLYLLYSPVCHQLPQRSFALQGFPWAVCSRCAGIYFGLFAGSLLPLSGFLDSLSGVRRRIYVLAASAPLVLDVFLPYAGLWFSSPASRFASGFVFGGMLMSLLVPGAGEFLSTIGVRPRPGSQCSQPVGGAL
jgi:uncharacterized membrane protein